MIEVRKLFDQPEEVKCQKSISTFEYEGVAYCFFVLTDQTLPTDEIAYDEKIIKALVCARAIYENIIKEGKELAARTIVRDYRCAHFIQKGIQAVKKSDILYHIFLAI